MVKPVLRLVFFAGFGAFIIGGLYFGYVFFAQTKAAVDAIFVSPVPQVVLATATTTHPVSTPAVAAANVTPTSIAPVSPTPIVVSTKDPVQPDWSQQERTNILVMGIDQRVDESTRTDTMIVVSVDPYMKTANVLSIPRDLWVTIPGFSPAKINAAYPLGESSGFPGGGPGLAEKTLEDALGIPINYFVTINFKGFQKVIDQLGGIDVDVPKYLRDDQYPTEDYRYQTVIFQPGLQHLNGERALQYSRTRHADSDFGRMRRQQQVIDAVRSKALSLDILPRLPMLLETLSQTLRTDLSLSQTLSLARLLGSIERSDITMRVIDETMTEDKWIGDQEVVWPIWSKIDPVIASTLADSRLELEGATIQVVSGTGRPAAARRAAAFLAEVGFDVMDGSPPRVGYRPKTEVVAYTSGKDYSRHYLAQLMGLEDSDVREESGGGAADFLVIVGADFRNTP